MPNTKRSLIAIILLILFLLSSVVARADGTPTFTLNPASGAISGAAGSTIGWGFTLTNTTDFLVVSSSDFCVGVITSPCTNSLGSYTDFIGPQFQVVGPSPESTSFVESSNLLAQTGVGSFTISAGALPGASVSGEIVVTYDLFSIDPNAPSFDPTLDTISTGDMLTADASVSVAGQAALPEPGTVSLLICGLVLAGVRKAGARRRQQLNAQD